MTDRSLIAPRTLPGFRDYLPATMEIRERLMDVARRVYRSFGFVAIDTPALEFTEILLGKGGDESDKQMFRFTDQGGRDVAMRFDLTVPFARFAAQHIGQLGTPFKRYHMGTVWRAEKQQKGRYREFVQCDFDTIGTTSPVADIETLMVINTLMEQLGLARVSVRVNHRQVLNGVLANLGLADHSASVLRALDKLAKIGRDAVITEMMATAAATPAQADAILNFAGLTGDPQSKLDAALVMVGTNEAGQSGIAQLRALFDVVDKLGWPADRVDLDLSIARGLDYYTGTIFETFLQDLPGIGSVCSGGRYDNLAGLYTNQSLPGVGASLGLDRLVAALEELNQGGGNATVKPVLVTQFEPDRLGDYMAMAQRLRTAGIPAEVSLEAKALGKQLKQADRNGTRIALIAGSQEFAAGVWQVKHLATGEQVVAPDTDVVATVQRLVQS